MFQDFHLFACLERQSRLQVGSTKRRKESKSSRSATKEQRDSGAQGQEWNKSSTKAQRGLRGRGARSRGIYWTAEVDRVDVDVGPEGDVDVELYVVLPGLGRSLALQWLQIDV